VQVIHGARFLAASIAALALAASVYTRAGTERKLTERQPTLA
jgi:hypothetical protein